MHLAVCTVAVCTMALCTTDVLGDKLCSFDYAEGNGVSRGSLCQEETCDKHSVLVLAHSKQHSASDALICWAQHQG